MGERRERGQAVYIWPEQVRRLRAPGYQALRTQRRDPTRGRQSIPWRYPPLRSLCPQRCRASAAPVPPATDGGLTSSASGWLSAAASLPAQPDVDALGLPRAHQLLSAVARRSRVMPATQHSLLRCAVRAAVPGIIGYSLVIGSVTSESRLERATRTRLARQPRAQSRTL